MKVGSFLPGSGGGGGGGGLLRIKPLVLLDITSGGLWLIGQGRHLSFE